MGRNREMHQMISPSLAPDIFFLELAPAKELEGVSRDSVMSRKLGGGEMKNICLYFFQAPYPC